MFAVLTWLHAFLPLIAHWSIAAALIAGAVAVYLFVPFQLARQVAIAVGAGAGIYIFAYTVGDRDGAVRVQAQWDQARREEAKRESDLKAKAAATEALLNTTTAALNATADELETAREALLAKDPVSPVCIDSADDVGSLRRLIQPR